MAIHIDREKCTGCGVCYSICPGDIYTFDSEKGEVHPTHDEECWLCGACAKDCPEEAIQLSLWWRIASA